MGGDQRPETVPLRTLDLTGQVLDAVTPPSHHGPGITSKVDRPIRVGGSTSKRADHHQSVPVGPGVKDHLVRISASAPVGSQPDLHLPDGNPDHLRE